MGPRASTVTRDSDPPAPVLHRPKCDHRLAYRDTVLSGVTNKPERWDRYTRQTHGLFDYRHRKKLRHLGGL